MPTIPDLVGDMIVVYVNFAMDRQVVARLISVFLMLDYLEKRSKYGAEGWNFVRSEGEHVI